MDNPYDPPTTVEPAQHKRLGTAIGVASFIIAAAPTCYLVLLMIQMYMNISAMESPPQNLRPVGSLIAGFKWSVVGLCVCMPLSFIAMKIAERLNSPTGKEFAMVGMGLFPLPLAVGFLGPIVVIALTGAGYGT